MAADYRRLRSIVRLLPLVFAVATAHLSAQPQPPIEANQNHTPAGVLRGGVLTIRLEIAKGEWHPEADNGIALSVYAFGEAGRALQNPGPLIRVPEGTEIHAFLHNTLAVPVSVHGLGDPDDGGAVVRVAPGAVEQVRFKARTAGLYFYWGASEGEDLESRYAIDSELTGALAVDPPGAAASDEIFVMEMLSEQPGLGARETLATINGKSWPYTRRFHYNLGESVHWRWINATNEPHALHLHGYYFRIDAFNRRGRIENYAGDRRPLVVTQRIAQGETFDMSWSPTRAGRWLFHCHMFQHMTPPTVPPVPGLSLRPASAHAAGHAMSDGAGMGQLVLGIIVPPSANTRTHATWHADRRLQLVISERGELPRYALQLNEGTSPQASPKEAGLLGPPIVLTQSQPVEIEVVNRLNQPTAIHWHGIEVEDSYYDGVPGWSGEGKRITPPIAPGASFIARMTPPRAGTFIYHTHWHEPSQLTNGIYGPLIVLPPGAKLDSASDLTFVFSIGSFGALHDLALINGTPQAKTLQLQAGKKYRFRLINISTNNQGMQVSLRDHNGPVEWRVIAKDGADLPVSAVHAGKAEQTVTVGETYDVEFSTATAQDLLLDLLLPGQKIHVTQTLSFVPHP